MIYKHTSILLLRISTIEIMMLIIASAGQVVCSEACVESFRCSICKQVWCKKCASVTGSKGAFICGQCPIRVVVEAPANERGDKDKFDFEIKMGQKLDVLIKRFCSDTRLDPER